MKSHIFDYVKYDAKLRDNHHNNILIKQGNGLKYPKIDKLKEITGCLMQILYNEKSYF